MQYRTLQNILHDGREIKPGELIELSGAQAAQLLELKAIEPAQRRFSKQISVPGTAN